MAVHRVNHVNWTTHLANLLDTAEEGDIILVHNPDMLGLASNALKRRQDGKYLRLMTEKTYQDIARADGEAKEPENETS